MASVSQMAKAPAEPEEVQPDPDLYRTFSGGYKSLTSYSEGVEIVEPTPVEIDEIPAIGGGFVIEAPIIIEHDVPPTSPCFAAIEFEKLCLAAQSRTDQRTLRLQSREKTGPERAKKVAERKTKISRETMQKLEAAKKEKANKPKRKMGSGTLEKRSKEIESGIMEIRGKVDVLACHVAQESALVAELQGKLGMRAIPVTDEDSALRKAHRGPKGVENWLLGIEEAVGEIVSRLHRQ
jgi:hypothetical protein